MQQKTCLKLFIALLSITVFFANCQKGDAGPAGPKGDTGATGAAGAAGSQGPKGDTGTANVIYSAWLDVAYTAHPFVSNGIADTTWDANITANKLSVDILNKGEVKVYVNFGSSASPVVIPLPVFDYIYGFTISVISYPTRIYLVSPDNLGTYTQSNVKYQQYRYILIPGVVNARVAQPVDWNDYNKVKEYLGLKD